MTLPGLVAANNLSDVVNRERAWDNLGSQFNANFDTLPLALGIGTATSGGYFAGYISHTANGIATHALIVAPAAVIGLTRFAWSPSYSTPPGPTSLFDGFANVEAMVAQNISLYPAAQFCANLNTGGYGDWYLPSLYELEIAYYNLKPTTTSNIITNGANPYSVPRRNTNYSVSVPARTSNLLFSGAQAFAADIYWTSTGFGSNFAWNIGFSNGSWNSASQFKVDERYIRPFRRIAL